MLKAIERCQTKPFSIHHFSFVIFHLRHLLLGPMGLQMKNDEWKISWFLPDLEAKRT
jgi:hypothetical protein